MTVVNERILKIRIIRYGLKSEYILAKEYTPQKETGQIILIDLLPEVKLA
ncbi:MAG: hypothetical protein LBT09_01605 [Planctomycetaceae bacterium]|jgi:hypothetical protein|nr:hypothetical protein [Planctomycetaceae bacterium]